MTQYRFETGEGLDKLTFRMSRKAAKLLEKEIRKAAADKEGFVVVAAGSLSTEQEAPKTKRSRPGRAKR